MKFYIIPLIVILMVLTTLTIGQVIYEDDFEKGEKRDIYNLTETKLVWNSTHFERKQISFSNDTIILISDRITNIVYKGCDFVGYSFFELAKFGIEFGYEHPEQNFQYYMNKIIWLIKVFFGLFLGYLIIINLLPLFAVFYLMGYGIYNFCIWINNKVMKK